MEIRHVVYTTKRFPNPSNGKHKVIENLAEEQALAGHRSEVVVLTSKEDIQPEHSHLNRRVHEVPSLMNRGAFLPRRRVEEVVGSLHEGLVFHIHEVLTPASLSIARYLHRNRIPYFVTPHAGYLHLPPPPRGLLSKSYLYLRLVERWMLDRAYAVVAKNPSEQAKLRKLSPRTRAELVLNGAYSSHRSGRPVRRVKWGKPDEELLFGYCSRLAISHKGIDFLLHGFAEYKRAGGKAMLEMIGDGDADAVRTLIDRLGIAPHVRMLGPKYGAEKDDLMIRWKFFVLTSRFEGAPLAAAEAAMLGLPCLLSSGTSMGSLIRGYDAGIVVDDLSAENVARALLEAEEVASSPERWEAVSCNAFDMALSEFDWTRIAGTLQDIYADAVNERRTAIRADA